MELILLRHGKAEPHGHPGGDAARALVTKGREQARRAARFLMAVDGLPEIVLTSPLLRALQTAEEFSEAAGLAAPLVQDWLASGMQPETAAAELAAFSSHRRIAIVGHEPDFSWLAGWLTGGGLLEVKKGALVSLDVQPPSRRGTLRYLIPQALMSPG
jgi:phosphohistidine phosphatase